MASRRALVVVNGGIAELPVGDTLVSTSILSVLNRATTIIQITISNSILTVLNRAGSTINIPMS